MASKNVAFELSVNLPTVGTSDESKCEVMGSWERAVASGAWLRTLALVLGAAGSI